MTYEVSQKKDTTNRILELCGIQAQGAMQVKLTMYSLILTYLFLRWDPKAGLGANPFENRRLRVASTFNVTKMVGPAHACATPEPYERPPPLSSYYRPLYLLEKSDSHRARSF